MEEIWKDIPGYSKYTVSNLGRIKSKPREYKQWRGGIVKKDSVIRKAQKNHRGYDRIQLYDDHGNFKIHSVHRIVASAFIPNPENKPQVNHINGVRNDNRVENLEWVTGSENMVHAIKTGLQKVVPSYLSKKAKFNLEDLSKIYKDYYVNNKRVKLIAIENEIQVSHCYSILRGQSYSKAYNMFKDKYNMK